MTGSPLGVTVSESAPVPQPSLLLGEAHGCVEVPLRGLPAGVLGVTVPRKRKDGDEVLHRVPQDLKRRVKPEVADLVAAGPVPAYAPPEGMPDKLLKKVLSTGTFKRWATIEREFGTQDAWRIAVSLILCGGVVVRCQVVQGTSYVPQGWRLTQSWADLREDKLAQLRGHPDPLRLHAELLQAMDGIPQLADERARLAATPPGRTLKVPGDSASGTEDWGVYEVAVKSAAVWWRAQPRPKPMKAKSLIGTSMQDTKYGWTPPRRQAFANLIGMPFDQAVEGSDTELRMRGPLLWRVDNVIADTAACRPWLGLPAKGLLSLGVIDCSAVGVLLVENQEAFTEVCNTPGIADHWLCIWGAGYAAHGLAEFLQAMAPLPVASWQDLDAHGIQIIANLSERVGRPITPVGMDVEVYRSATKYRQKPDKLAGNLALARKMVVSGPPSLRALAAEIVAHGGAGCEHETLYDTVLETLPSALKEIVGSV